MRCCASLDKAAERLLLKKEQTERGTERGVGNLLLARLSEERSDLGRGSGLTTGHFIQSQPDFLHLSIPATIPGNCFYSGGEQRRMKLTESFTFCNLV
jgi:hypothetical protein